MTRVPPVIVEEHPVADGAAGPYALTTGPDGALWFTEYKADRIGRITPDGRITEFPLPDRAARPHAVTVDGRGTAWFTEWGGNRVGAITLDGSLTTYDLPPPAPSPTASPWAPTARCGPRWRSAPSPASPRRTALPERHGFEDLGRRALRRGRPLLTMREGVVNSGRPGTGRSGPAVATTGRSRR